MGIHLANDGFQLDIIATGSRKYLVKTQSSPAFVISERHLHRICKVCVNKPLSELNTERIPLEVKRMMVFSKNLSRKLPDNLFVKIPFFPVIQEKLRKNDPGVLKYNLK